MKTKDKFLSLIDKYILEHSLLCILLVYNTVILITSAALYKLIPILLCYEDNVRESSKAVNFSYDAQFLIGTAVVIAASTIFLSRLFKDINKYKALSADNRQDLEKLNAIRRKCMNTPYIIYLCQVFIPVGIVSIVGILSMLVLKTSIILSFKLVSLAFSFCFLSAIVAYTFSRKIFSKILYGTYIGSKVEGFRLEIGTKILLQIIPMVVTAILITSLLGYSKLVEEKGDLLQMAYKLELQQMLKDTGSIKDSSMLLLALEGVKLENVKTTYFVASPKETVTTSDGTILPDYFTNFLKNPVRGYRLYGYTKEMQGVIQKVSINGEIWSAGVIFEVESPGTVRAFIAALLILTLVNAMVLYLFSRSVSLDIAHVSNSLMEISRGGSIGERRDIPVTSNDEIGDLIAAFNNIQRLETEYDDMKNEFFANVSHELRTPLNIILASVQLFSSYNSTDRNSTAADVDKISDMIKQNSYRLLRLVNNLIDSSKIKASFYDMHMKNCNIINVVEEISLSVANYIKEKDIEFLFDTDVEEKYMSCDTDMIERVMLNLLSNAVKFTGPGGKIFVSMQDEENSIIISVKDSGIGMTEEEQSMIFERFKQVDKSLKRKREGSGIGLSLVKLLVEMHKGTIAVKSEPGKGSEFIVTLPVIDFDEQKGEEYLQKQIYSEKVDDNMEKIKIEFSDIYF